MEDFLSEFDTIPKPEIQQVLANQEDVKRRLRDDREFFIQFFMTDELIFPIPQFHIEIFNLMLNSTVSKLALAIPRGHSKTTLSKLAVVYYFLFTDYSFIVYVSNTSDVAQAACRDIVAFLTGRNCMNVFGEIEKRVWREGEGLFVFELNGKTCILRALGAGQQVRGLNIENRRPEMAVVDDLEDDDNTATKPLRDKLNNWVYGAFFKAMNAWKARIIWLGNLLSDKSILKQHLDDPDWASIRLGCILEDGNPLWPDLWPLPKIKADYESYKKRGLTARWFAEMMNLPMPDGGSIIDVEEINYKSPCVPGDILYGFICLDPALGQTVAHDFSGITVHGYVKNGDDGGFWQIVESIKVKADPVQLFHICMALLTKWGLRIIGMESVAFQAVLKFMFEYLLKAFPGNHVELVKLTTTTRKAARIQTWVGMIRSQEYALTEGETEITDQLLAFDPSKRDNEDDLIDSAAHGVQMINEYGAMIFSQMAAELPEITFENEICQI